MSVFRSSPPLGVRTARQCLLRLPPDVRTSLYRPSLRSFHATPTRRVDAVDIIDGAVAVPHFLLNHLHFLGLPWAAVLPLAALIVRSAIVLPFITLPARRAQQRRMDLVPLDQAWTNAIMRRSGVSRDRERFKEAKNMLDKRRRSIYWEHNATAFRLLMPLFQLPIFLLMAESIRRMAGRGGGALGLVAGWLSPRAAGSDPSAIQPSAAEPTAPAELSSSTDTLYRGLFEARSPKTESIAEGGSSAAGSDASATQSPPESPILPDSNSSISAVAQPDPSSLDHYAAAWREPTLATEGMLWFPDLTLPDPTLTLPFMVSGITFYHIYSNAGGGVRPGAGGVAELGAGPKALRRLLLTVALSIGPATLQVPSAIMLYWFSSMTLATVQTKLLDRYMPFRMPIRACKKRISRPPSRRKEEAT
ncbi:hypothetical protein B0A49_11852 [Cryomyces minteri]|uniref:Mitochondrial inner membrane protein COX18 n=1 Tax=Cryomyces minteri TaxID=331657 RepID=A0A4U0VWD2_9PEZI|nr:hypothetical protein B0A49_11852 [Cryomyces minteri]